MIRKAGKTAVKQQNAKTRFTPCILLLSTYQEKYKNQNYYCNFDDIKQLFFTVNNFNCFVVTDLN